jgi:hypothetical protein
MSTLPARQRNDFACSIWAAGVDVNETWRDLPAQVCLLLALGLKPQGNDEIVRDALESHNVAMLDLLASSAVSVNAPRGSIPRRC